MNLWIVGVKWPPETFIERRIRGLIASGIEVTVCSASPSVLSAQSNSPGLSLLYLPRLSRNWRNLLALARLIAMKLATAPRKSISLYKDFLGNPGWQAASHLLKTLPFINEKPDIIHFEWNFAAVDYLPLFDLLDCPIVISCRGSQIHVAPHNPENSNKVKKLPATFQRAAAVHCVSQAICEDAIKYGLDPKKAWIIRPAVDPDFFVPNPESIQATDNFRVITTGSLIWQKGHEYALQAINLLKDRHIDVRFTIIGDGPERQRVLYTIQDLGLEKEVQLVGSVPPAHVRDLLQQADIFLLSSLSEGISNAVLEAMACGLPVVTTDCGGMREAVTDGIEGFTVPVRDPETMAAALAKLARDPELRSRMGRAARDRILKQFTLAQQTAAFIELYQSLMKVPKHN